MKETFEIIFAILSIAILVGGFFAILFVIIADGKFDWKLENIGRIFVGMVILEMILLMTSSLFIM